MVLDNKCYKGDNCAYSHDTDILTKAHADMQIKFKKNQNIVLTVHLILFLQLLLLNLVLLEEIISIILKRIRRVGLSIKFI
jgi:hypothetical protein